MRYWVASGPGNWNDPANWAYYSGGPGGAAVPTIGNAVYFNAGGVGNCTLQNDVSVSSLDMNCDQYTGTFSDAGYTLTTYGDLMIYTTSTTVDRLNCTGVLRIAANGRLGVNKEGNVHPRVEIADNVAVTNVVSGSLHWVIAKKIVVGENATVANAVLAPWTNTENNPIVIPASATIYSSTTIRFYGVVAPNNEQAGFVTQGDVYLNYFTSTLKQTGDVTARSLIVHGWSTTTNEWDTNGFNLNLTGSLQLGISVAVPNTYKGRFYGRTGTHVVATDVAAGGVNTLGYLNLGSCSLTVKRNLDLRYCTVEDAGSSVVSLTAGLNQSVYANGQTLNDLTVNKSAGRVTFQDAYYGDRLDVLAGDVDCNGQTLALLTDCNVDGSTGGRFWNGTDADQSSAVIDYNGVLTLAGTGSAQLQIDDLDFVNTASDTPTAVYCTVTNSNRTGTGPDIAACETDGNVDNGGNTGWDFCYSSSSSSSVSSSSSSLGVTSSSSSSVGVTSSSSSSFGLTSSSSSSSSLGLTSSSSSSLGVSSSSSSSVGVTSSSSSSLAFSSSSSSSLAFSSSSSSSLGVSSSSSSSLGVTSSSSSSLGVTSSSSSSLGLTSSSSSSSSSLGLTSSSSSSLAFSSSSSSLGVTSSSSSSLGLSSSSSSSLGLSSSSSSSRSSSSSSGHSESTGHEAVKVRIVQVALRTSTGTQDVTISGFSYTVKAALFFLSNATTNGTRADNATLSFGATDGTEHWNVAVRDTDNAGVTAPRRDSDLTNVAVLMNASGTAVVQVRYSAFIADGVRINVAATDGGAYLLSVMLFGGADLSAECSYFTAPAAGAATSVTVGFMPNLIFCGTSGQSFAAASDTYDIASFGAAALTESENALTQAAIATRVDPGAAISNVAMRADNADIASQVSMTSRDWYVRITDIFATTFRVWNPGAGDAAGDQVGFLALRTGNLRAYAGLITTDTDLGQQAYTQPGFRPQAVLLGITDATAANTSQANGDAFGFGLFDKEAREASVVAVSGDNLDVTNTFSVTGAAAVNHDDDNAGTARDLIDAAYYGMNPTGFTLNYTTVTATPRYYLCVAVEDSYEYVSSSSSSLGLSSSSSSLGASTPSSLTSLTSLTSAGASMSSIPASIAVSDIPPPPMLPQRSSGVSGASIPRGTYCIWRWQYVAAGPAWVRLTGVDRPCGCRPPEPPGKFLGQVAYTQCGGR